LAVFVRLFAQKARVGPISVA